MKNIFQYKGSKKESLCQSSTIGKHIDKRSLEKNNNFSSFNHLKIEFNRSQKFGKESSSNAKRPKKKENDESPKKKNHQTVKYRKKFIDSKLEKKIESYFLFLALTDYTLKLPYIPQIEKGKYVAYVGKGNNSKLIKGILRKRYWWTFEDNIKSPNINFIWTQWSKTNILERVNQREKKKVKYEYYYNELKQQKNDANHFCMIFQKPFIIETDKEIKYMLKNKTYKKSKVSLPFSCNHVLRHEQLSDKKNLFLNMSIFCAKKKINFEQILPLTFHVSGEESELTALLEKEASLLKESSRLMWILKPGERTNRGSGIFIFKKISQIKEHISKEKQSEKYPNRTYIIQKYIYPSLLYKRKFDIRCFVLLIASPNISAYFYREGYLRTSSKQYKEKNVKNRFIHLTNDAIQKKSLEYGKHEKGNKIKFSEYEEYLRIFEKERNISFKNSILPKIKKFASISIGSVSNLLNKGCREYSFQILGYDFLLDENYSPWLIQINTNPCFETGCPVSDSIIPSMLNNAFKLTLDTVFRPPKLQDWPLQQIFTFPGEILEENKFELIYQENIQ